MIRLFAGYDAREALGWHVFVSSVIERATMPVSIQALSRRGLPAGSNDFTVSRFLVPWLCRFAGRAIFVDGSDMLVQADIAELDALFDPRFAVQVVRHPSYRTKHKLKYVGTSMQCPNLDYERKQWASVMLLNCAHPFWRRHTPETLAGASAKSLLQFDGLEDSAIGDLPGEWNRIVDEGQSPDGAKLLHWTAGTPAFPHYRNAPAAELWHAAQSRMLEVA